MKITILAFGIVKEIIDGNSKEIIQQDRATVEDLKSLLEANYPEMKELQAFFIAVNNEYAKDEIAVIPPVSGG